MTVISDSLQIVPEPVRRRRRPCAPPTRGVADALESVLVRQHQAASIGAQWRLVRPNGATTVVLRSMPAEPLTVARYLAAPRR